MNLFLKIESSVYQEHIFGSLKNQYTNQLIFWCLKACILYILRVGVTDQMTEPTQRAFLVFLGKQVCWHNSNLFCCHPGCVTVLTLFIWKSSAWVCWCQSLHENRCSTHFVIHIENIGWGEACLYFSFWSGSFSRFCTLKYVFLPI